VGLIWGTIISVLGLVGAILIAIIGRLVSEDIKEWLPWITRRLIERAVSRLPEAERKRREEEWWSHVNEWPGGLAKVYVAWGYLSASKAIRHMVLSGETPHIRESIREQTRQVMGTLIAATLLFLGLPLFLFLALCIKFENQGGPVLVRQKRLGANNVPFDLLKFRSMYVEQTDPFGHRLTRAGDPRITRVGRFLRYTGSDGLPQFINVLRGDMALVGPQPHPVVANAATIYPIRHRIKPGITGLAQVNGLRRETTIERVRQSVVDDLYYIENRSITLDLLILRRAVAAFLLGENAI
jgi:lipopolysaccharide/colanic/teichoic acid biosynthesis glycosyltransferase